MIIWLNGAFGAGKTQTAYELRRRLPGSYVYDPENAGFFIRDNLPPGLGLDDFQDFPMIAFWTKPGAPFLCMEPWHGCAAYEDESGEFADKPHVVRLAPGEEKRLEYTVTLR